MKQMLTTSLWVLLLAFATNAQDTTKAQNAAMNQPGQTDVTSMKGAYTMLSQRIGINQGDSTLRVQQFKIYTDRHFMYAHALPNDSVGDFGIGTYQVQNGKIIENRIYTAANGPRQETFELAVLKTPDGYSQIINLPPDNEGRSYMLVEDYRNVSRNVSSPLDGAWKMTRATAYPKGGSPQVVNDPVQFKVYQSGHVIWANTHTDSATQKKVSAFGYGSFKMNGANQAVETITESTYRSSLLGHPVTLKLAFTSMDRYQQTIVWPNGDRTVEEYERLQ